MRIHPEGSPFLIGALVISAIAYFMINTNIGILGLVAAGSIAFFFRDPERVQPDGEDLIVSPADGIVIEVAQDKPPIENEAEAEAQKYKRISIFLRVWDVHVIRAPIGGTVTQKAYKRGGFAHAESERALLENENLTIKIEGKVPVYSRQVAGMIARRIVCYAENGNSLKLGERYGIIRFGSRVDLYVPEECEILVKKGQFMVGGETVVAKIKN